MTAEPNELQTSLPTLHRSATARLAARIKAIRGEMFGGPDGVAEIAAAFGLPTRTWAHYESGVTMPATILLAFIELTGANPHWLLTGNGPRRIEYGPFLNVEPT